MIERNKKIKQEVTIRKMKKINPCYIKYNEEKYSITTLPPHAMVIPSPTYNIWHVNVISNYSIAHQRDNANTKIIFTKHNKDTCLTSIPLPLATNFPFSLFPTKPLWHPCVDDRCQFGLELSLTLMTWIIEIN